MTTSKELVKQAIEFRNPERIPYNFDSNRTPVIDELSRRYAGRICFFCPTDIWATGLEWMSHGTGRYLEQTNFPLEHGESPDDLANIQWPDPDWFDYAGMREDAERLHPDPVLMSGYMALDGGVLVLADRRDGPARGKSALSGRARGHAASGDVSADARPLIPQPEGGWKIVSGFNLPDGSAASAGVLTIPSQPAFTGFAIMLEKATDPPLDKSGIPSPPPVTP